MSHTRFAYDKSLAHPKSSSFDVLEIKHGVSALSDISPPTISGKLDLYPSH